MRRLQRSQSPNRIPLSARALFTELVLYYSENEFREPIRMSDRVMMRMLELKDVSTISKAKYKLADSGLLYFVTEKGKTTYYFFTEESFRSFVEELDKAHAEAEKKRIAKENGVLETVLESVLESVLVTNTVENCFSCENQSFSEEREHEKSVHSNYRLYNIYSNNIYNNISNTTRTRAHAHEEENPKWKTDFDTYRAEAEKAMAALIDDKDFINDRQVYYPYCDIPLSIQKVFHDYWLTDNGWKNKKKSKSKTIDWPATIRKSLSYSMNRINLNQNKNGSSQPNNTASTTKTSTDYYEEESF